MEEDIKAANDKFDRQMCELVLKNGSSLVGYWNGKTYDHNSHIWFISSNSSDYQDVSWEKENQKKILTQEIKYIQKIKQVDLKAERKKRKKALRSPFEFKPMLPKTTKPKLVKEKTIVKETTRWEFLEL